MVDMSDYRVFGDFLSRAKERSGKKFKRIEYELKASVSTWHDGTQLPRQERLPDIAVVYGVSLDDLTEAYRRAKAAREEEKKARRNVTICKDRFVPDAYGVVRDRSVLSHSNTNVWGNHFGGTRS